MFAKKDMLPEEDLRQVKERLQSLNGGLELPQTLSAEELHKRLTAEDCRNFREAGHPDFMYWQRYAGMVASFIVVLAGIVMFHSGYLNFDKFVSPAESGAAAAPMAAVADIAAMDMDEAVMEEAAADEPAEAEMPAPESQLKASAAPAVRSRLYASGYEYIVGRLEEVSQNAPMDGGAAQLELLSAGEESSDSAGLKAPDVTWQKEFSDTPGEGADILKSDGTYFYYYAEPYTASQTGKVYIIEAETLEEVSVINTGANDGTELFIRDGRLILISQNRQDTASVLYDSGVMTDSSGQHMEADLLKETALQRAETYGITTVSVYDLSDISQPQLVRSFMQDGLYQNSRLVGGRVFLFTRKDTLPHLTAGENALLCDTLPIIWDNFTGGGSMALASDMVAIAPNAKDNCYTTVSMFDVASDSPVITNSILGASQSYLSDSAIYFCYGAEDSMMGIIRMAVGMDSLNITSQTLLQGDFERPFAINRYEDILRVATVTPNEGGQEYSNVYLMDNNFQMIGSAEGLGTGEQVTDIRFVGDVAYIISQREQRPVFGLDVSDPTDAVILGQLDTEALPNSFRLIDGNLLIGVKNGEEDQLLLTADNVSRGWVEAKYSQQLPGATGTSLAAADYRALLYNSENRLIGFPVICRQTNGALLHWGYAVYEVEEDGINRVGMLSHAEVLNESIDQQHRSILRGRIIADRLYTFSGSMIKSHDITTMSEENTLRIH